VQAYREHWKNKLKSAKTPEQTAEYTQKRNRCTEMLKKSALSKTGCRNARYRRAENQTAAEIRAEYSAQQRSIRVGKRLPYARCKNRQNTVEINWDYPFQIQNFD
jgi:hypothetical protein